MFAGCSFLSEPEESNGPTETPGGGVTATATVTPSQVDTRDGLARALEAASSGDVVSVRPDAEIDLSDIWHVEVPAGVTLSGGRGVGGADGARFYSTEGDEGERENSPQAKFSLGNGARFTGFRLEGHHHQYVNAATAYDGDFFAHRGCGVRVARGGVVDNNEISGWPYSAIIAEDDAHVHNNFLHHNTWEGLGYGVAVPKGPHMPVVEFNEFNYNRHSITSARSPEPGYICRYNVFGEDWVGHQVDVHGTEGMTGVAGNKFLIHNNTFRATHVVDAKTRDPEQTKYPAVYIRGTPRTGAWIEQNWFYHESRDGAFQQPDGPENVHFSNNHYGRSSPKSPFVGVPEF